MRVSAAGRAFIEREEGCVLHAYSDAAPGDPPERKPVLTIGYGHTGPDVHDGLVWDQKRADQALAGDLMCVEHVIDQHCRIPPTQNQFDAMASLALNIGGHAFAESTVVRDYNRGDMEAAADAFLMWQKPPRLQPRRKRERALFLTPYVRDEA